MEQDPVTQVLNQTKGTGVDPATQRGRDAAQNFWDSHAGPAIQKAAQKAFTPEETQKRHLLKSQLKHILKNYPDLNLEYHEDFEASMDQLSTDMLQLKVAQAKQEVGIECPRTSAKAVVQLCGGIFERFFGIQDCAANMEEDEDLITAIEYYIPDLSDYMSLPMIILSRLFAHLTGRGCKRKRITIEDEPRPTKRHQGGGTAEPPQ